MTRNEYTVDELADVLLRAGFVECNIAACNCGSWHHRYGLPERFSEIKDALMDAGVLNNETGNLPIRAIAKLVEQRDALAARLAEAERDAALGRVAIRFVDRAGDYCDVDPAERICDEFSKAMSEELDRQLKGRFQRDAAMKEGK